MKKLSIIALAMVSYLAVSAQTNWKVDKSHSNVRFAITHLVISEVEGSFKVYDGKVTSKSPTDFTDAKIDFSVDVKSIFTDNDMRDNHLKSDDFFNAEKYPSITFKSTSFKKVKDKTYTLEGDLTIRDVTKRVKFDVSHNGIVKDGYGNTKAGFKASTSINRFDYKLKWSSVTESGGMVAGDEVRLTVNIQLEQQK